MAGTKGRQMEWVPSPQYENWLTFCLYQTERSTTEIKHYFSTWNGICFIFILTSEININVLFVVGRFLIQTFFIWSSQNYWPQIRLWASLAKIYVMLINYIQSWIVFEKRGHLHHCYCIQFSIYKKNYLTVATT